MLVDYTRVKNFLLLQVRLIYYPDFLFVIKLIGLLLPKSHYNQ